MKENFVLSKIITTEDFALLSPINVYHREYDNVNLPQSPFNNYHAIFSKTFIGKKGNGYEIKISADDYYKLYVNDNLVCVGVRQKDVKNYAYNKVDISKFILDGENEIKIHAYYHGRISRSYLSGDNRFMIIAEIYENGKAYFGTDKSWVYEKANCYFGETYGYDTAFTERINLNESNSAKKQCVEITNNDYLFEDTAEPCVDLYTITPNIVKRKNGLFIDLLKEQTGTISFVASGNKNAEITVKYGECLDENGEVYCNTASLKYVDSVILNGEKTPVEFFDYKAFRYLFIEFSENAKVEDIKIIVRHKKFSPIQEISTNDERIKSIYDLCVHTIKIGTQEQIVDCPSREKGQYLGDFTVSGLSHLYLTGDVEFYKSVLRDFASSVTNVSDSMMAVFPCSHMQEFADYSLQYPLQILSLYNYTKNKEDIIEFIPVAEKVLSHFEKQTNENGLLVSKLDMPTLIDWPMNLRDGYEFDTSSFAPNCVINAHYIGAIKTLNVLKNLLGLPTCLDKQAKLEKAFLNEFFDAEKGLFKDTKISNHSALHSNALPLFYDLAPKSSIDSITELIKEKGFICGTHFAYFVLKGLCNANQKQVAYDLMLNGDKHGWLNMLKEDATCAFEVWAKDLKWNTSLCHPWSTAPIILLNEDFNNFNGNKIVKK